MTARRKDHRGWSDAHQLARLEQLAETGRYLVIYGGSRPDSEGNGGDELTKGNRPEIAWGPIFISGPGSYAMRLAEPAQFVMPRSCWPTGYGIAETPEGAPVYIGHFPPQGMQEAGKVYSVHPFNIMVLAESFHHT